MAEGKKGFLLYADIIYTIEHLTNEEKGLLFQHLLEYVNDMNPTLEDRILLIAWKPIERQLKRDLQKYEGKKEERSRAGKLGNLKRYHEDLYKSVISEELTLEQGLAMAKTRKYSHSDTNLADNDSDTDNGTVNDSKYTKDNFLENWNYSRSNYTGEPSHINKLTKEEGDLFWNCQQEYTKDDFHKAINGLFLQKKIPYDSMWFRPKHMLKHIETYIDAFNNKKKDLY